MESHPGSSVRRGGPPKSLRVLALGVLALSSGCEELADNYPFALRALWEDMTYSDVSVSYDCRLVEASFARQGGSEADSGMLLLTCEAPEAAAEFESIPSSPFYLAFDTRGGLGAELLETLKGKTEARRLDLDPEGQVFRCSWKSVDRRLGWPCTAHIPIRYRDSSRVVQNLRAEFLSVSITTHDEELEGLPIWARATLTPFAFVGDVVAGAAIAGVMVVGIFITGGALVQ